MNLAPRPASVTIFGSLVVIVAIIRLLTVPLMLFSEPARERVIGMGVTLGIAATVNLLRAAISLTGAIGFLAGLNWARILYIVAVPVAIAADLLAYGFQPSRLVRLPIDLAVYGLVVFFLTRPDAVAFFKRSSERTGS